MTLELTTVGDDLAVLHDGPRVVRADGLDPDREYTVEGVTFRTLPRPPGERLATVTTVNDVHFGETVCGHVDGFDAIETFSVGPGEPPYPETMNKAACAEMAAVAPDAVVVKGDLTAAGTEAEYEQFLACYRPMFGDRLHHIRGNHDAYHGGTFATFGPFTVELPGVVLAVIDTTIPGRSSGGVTEAQLAWLDDLGASVDSRPVLVFGHHHCWAPGSTSRSDTYFGIHPDDSEALVAVFARRRRLAGYFAGHTHRNRVRRFAATGARPWVEVSCVKDFPGTWAEYRVFEGGILQVAHRISAPEALAWTDRTRGMFGGTYPAYSFGRLEDRCFRVC